MSNSQNQSVNNKKPNVFFTTISAKPLQSFIFSIVLLAALITASYFLRTPKEDAVLATEQIIPVRIQSLDDQYLTVQGLVQKEGFVQIISQASGVVQKVNVQPGQTVKANTGLIQLSNNYSGGNISALQAQQANLSYTYNQNNINTQKEIIARQRTLADTQFDAAEHTLDFSRDSLATTKDNLIVTHDQLNYLQSSIEALEKTNVNGVNDAALSPLRGSKIQLLSTLSQLDSAVKSLEYQTKEDTFTTQSPTVQHELTLKQLELQEKSLDLQLSSSKLGLQIAQVQASLMAPVIPIAGVVQQVNVKKGDLISPGQVIAVISNDNGAAYLDIPLSKEAAQSLNYTAPVKVMIGQKTYDLDVTFVSNVPVNGNAYNLRVNLSPEIADLTSPKSNLVLKLPLTVISENVASSSTKRMVAIDAIYQTQASNYLYLVAPNEAGSPSATLREIELGKVIGGQVEVLSGLSDQDQVILNRRIKSGDLIEIIR